MDFNDLKQFISTDNEKVILVEDGKPTVVLMSFESYKKKFNLKKEEKKEEVVQKQKKDLTLEDLPF